MYVYLRTSGRWPVIKTIAESLSQHDEKHVVPTTLSGIRVGKVFMCMSLSNIQIL
jgi:hypothetical protein